MWQTVKFPASEKQRSLEVKLNTAVVRLVPIPPGVTSTMIQAKIGMILVLSGTSTLTLKSIDAEIELEALPCAKSPSITVNPPIPLSGEQHVNDVVKIAQAVGVQVVRPVENPADLTPAERIAKGYRPQLVGGVVQWMKATDSGTGPSEASKESSAS